MRIHIVCPSAEVTGSAESLHQFGRAAATQGWDVRIAYGGDPIFGAVPSAFRSYGLRNDQDVADESDVIALVAHTDVEAVAHLTHARKLIWWLRPNRDATGETERALAVPGAIHLAQSEYARHFLAEHGVDAQLVGDYVSAAFIERAAAFTVAARLDTILYNLDVTDEMTPQLIEASSGVLQWVPVTGLSRDEVAELMAYSKVYVDFGAHPGGTRQPREALVAGCVVVTGRRGAAGNRTDLALPEGFSFDETESSVLTVLNRIALTVMEFDDATAEFAAARSRERALQSEFGVAVADVLQRVVAGEMSLADR